MAMTTLIRTSPFTSMVVRRPAEKNCCYPVTSDQFLTPKSVMRTLTCDSFISLDASNGRSRFFQGRSRSGITVSAISNSSGSVSSLITEDTSNSLENLDVFDLNGKAIKISDLWKDRKAVVAFARHFGCVLCRKRADLLASVKDQMDAAGVTLVLIGPGSVDQAKVFYEQTKFRGGMISKVHDYHTTIAFKLLTLLTEIHSEVYADPSYSSYKALKFVSGISTTFTPKAGLKIIQLYMEGYRQDWELSFEKDTRTKGGWQQGGIIVAGPGKNNISYIHKDKEAGDDPEIEEVLKACCS